MTSLAAQQHRAAADVTYRRSGKDNADAHLKRHVPPGEAVVVAVIGGRLDGSTEFTPRARRNLWHL